MKVALLIHGLSQTAAGVFEVVRAHAKHLSANGIQVGVFGYQQEKECTVARLFPPEVLVAPEKPWGPQHAGISPALHRRIIDFKPDLIHTHGIWTGLSVLSLTSSRRLGVPLLISPHGMLDPWAVQRSPVKKIIANALFEKRHLKHAAALHALCDPEVRAIRAELPEKDVFLLPNGVELPSGHELSCPWTDETGKTFLFLGRIHPKKGVFELVEAWKQIEGALPDWTLRIAGWGQPEDEKRLRARISTIRRVEFLGPQDEQGRNACYQHADAFVLPSFSEGMPMTVLEAWSHSLPVLMTAACNLERAFQVGAALRVSSDSELLAKALVDYTRLDPSITERMGKIGRELCESDYRWSAVVRTLTAHYLRLASKG